MYIALIWKQFADELTTGCTSNQEHLVVMRISSHSIITATARTIAEERNTIVIAYIWVLLQQLRVFVSPPNALHGALILQAWSADLSKHLLGVVFAAASLTNNLYELEPGQAVFTALHSSHCMYSMRSRPTLAGLLELAFGTNLNRACVE